MKEIYQLPDTLPTFYNSQVSESVLVEFNNEDILYIIGIIDIKVIEGEIDTWGFTMTADSPMATLYSSGSHGLISITSAYKRKAIVELKKNVNTDRWKSFMKEYVPSFLMFDVNGTRLTPPKALIKLEEQLGCWFDLSKTPLSNHRLIIDEQWQGLSNDLLTRPTNEPIKVLFAGYKNSGKSTMMRYYINRCLKKWDKILVLDFDIGQSEFSVPGCVSAFIITSPLLGPNFTHLLQPIKSYFFGSNDVMTNVLLYNEIVSKIVDDILPSKLYQIPCFINTMGFVEGPGLHILHNIIAKTKPTDVIQLKFNENQDLNLHSEMVNDDTNCSLSYDLWYFTSAVKNKSAKAPHIPNFNKHLAQHFITTSYFSKCLQCTDVYFNDVVPYKVNINNISILINVVEQFSQDELMSIINANVVALCISTEINICECVGFGFIRNLNKSTGDIFVITPVAPNLLSRVNQLRLGNINLPATFYTKRSKIANYVCTKQDNIFNENITRQYKVML